jgi:hypothetical protein
LSTALVRFRGSVAGRGGFGGLQGEKDGLQPEEECRCIS